MIKILRKYEENGLLVTEYTKDGVTVTNVTKIAIPTEPIEPDLQATIEEQILAENQYQTALLEMQMLGGM